MYIVLMNETKNINTKQGEKAMTKEITINIIREGYEGNHQEVLSYCWEDYETKTAGIDIEVSSNGIIDYVAIAQKAMQENGADAAYVNCMWGHGFSGIVKKDEKITKTTEKKETIITQAEETTQTQIIEKYSDHDKKNHTGWCDRCKSYCYGDCEAN